MQRGDPEVEAALADDGTSAPPSQPVATATPGSAPVPDPGSVPSTPGPADDRAPDISGFACDAMEIPDELKNLLSTVDDTEFSEDLADVYREAIEESITADKLLWMIKVIDFRYAELEPDAHLMISRLSNTARKLVRLYMAGDKARIKKPDDPFLVELLSTLYPDPDTNTIKSALAAAYHKENR